MKESARVRTSFRTSRVIKSHRNTVLELAWDFVDIQSQKSYQVSVQNLPKIFEIASKFLKPLCSFWALQIEHFYPNSLKLSLWLSLLRTIEFLTISWNFDFLCSSHGLTFWLLFAGATKSLRTVIVKTFVRKKKIFPLQCRNVISKYPPLKTEEEKPKKRTQSQGLMKRTFMISLNSY